MKKINISTKTYPNTFTLVDDEDYDYLNQWKWYKNTNGYVARAFKKDNKKSIIMLHRQLLRLNKYSQKIDHINHNKLDNRKCNLRICSSSQNNMNRLPHKTKTSVYKGVRFASTGKKIKRWYAQIKSVHFCIAFVE